MTPRFQAAVLEMLKEDDGTLANCTDALTALKAKYGSEDQGPVLTSLKASVRINNGVAIVRNFELFRMADIFGISRSFENKFSITKLVQQADGTWLVDDAYSDETIDAELL